MSFKKLDCNKSDFEKEYISRINFRIKQLTEAALDEQLRLAQQKDKSHSQKLAKNSNF